MRAVDAADAAAVAVVSPGKREKVKRRKKARRRTEETAKEREREGRGFGKGERKKEKKEERKKFRNNPSPLFDCDPPLPEAELALLLATDVTNVSECFCAASPLLDPPPTTPPTPRTPL